MNRCDCEHWEICPTCFPQGYDDDGNRKLVEVPPKRAELVERIAALEAENKRLIDAGATYQKKWMDSVDATKDLANDMERLMKIIRYLVGIAERGSNAQWPEGVTAEQFVLGYVKSIEAENAKLNEAVGGFKRDLIEKLDQQRKKNRRLESTIAQQAERLAAAEKAMNRCYKMLLSEPDTKGALFKAENILREALADAAIATSREAVK